MSTKLTEPRRATTAVRVGGLTIGGDAPVAVQTMTTTATDDVDASVAQTLRLARAGAALVRLTAQGELQAKALEEIHRRVREAGCQVPLSADIHFNPRAAFEAARWVEKVRINPGNFADPARTFRQIEYTDEQYAEELRRIDEAFGRFVDTCRQRGVAIRVGVNHGSLSDRILSRYGNTPEGMVESAMEYLRVARRRDFDQIVISLKASDTPLMVRAVRLLVEAMDREDMHYPLHLGVTEAGDGLDGRIKSALGIGTLLRQGIGDTIRVSLCEDPAEEVPVARALAYYARHGDGRHAALDGRVLRLSYKDTEPQSVAIKAAVDAGRALIDGLADDVAITAPLPEADLRDIEDRIMQAAKLRFTHTEYIACPGCGRTLYDLPDTLRRVREATGHLAGLRIAVMGCIVNGPGEMNGADYGYVGAARGRISLYRGRECVERNIPSSQAVDRLVALIRADGRWSEPISDSSDSSDVSVISDVSE